MKIFSVFKNLLMVLIVIAVISLACLIFFPFIKSTPFPDVINKASLTASPMIFFVYPDKLKNEWRDVIRDEQIKKILEKFISQNVKSGYFLSTAWAPLFSEMKSDGLLILNYKGEKIDFYARFTPLGELVSIMENALEANAGLIAKEKQIRKKFETIKMIFDDAKYLESMRQLRKFLSVYSNSECAVEARDLLQECAKKPEIITHLKNNRDAANRKKMLYQVKESFEYKKYFNSEKLIGIILSNYPNTKEAQEAEKIKEKIAFYAQTKFKEANKLYSQRKYDQALEAYTLLHDQFKGTHWDLFISGKLQQIQADKNYRKYRDEQVRKYEALHIFRRAEKAFKTNQWDMAQRLYTSIMRFYPDTEFVKKSEQRIKKMNELRYNVLPQKDNDS